MLKTKKLFMIAFTTLLLSAVVADAFADEGDQMSWDLKNRSKMSCKLVGGMTLKRGLDFVETKKLVCYEKGGLLPVVTQTVSCGPEGSVTRFGKKVKVTCHTTWYAAK